MPLRAVRWHAWCSSQVWPTWPGPELRLRRLRCGQAVIQGLGAAWGGCGRRPRRPAASPSCKRSAAQVLDNWANFEAYGLPAPVGLLRADAHRPPFRRGLCEARAPPHTATLYSNADVICLLLVCCTQGCMTV